MRRLRRVSACDDHEMHSAGYANSPWRRCSRASTHKNPLSMTIRAQRSTNKLNLRTLPIDFSLFLALSRASGLRESSRAAIVTFSKLTLSFNHYKVHLAVFLGWSQIKNIFPSFATATERLGTGNWTAVGKRTKKRFSLSPLSVVLRNNPNDKIGIRNFCESCE